MKRKLAFLGIETSCDETAASIVTQENNELPKVLSNVVSSQIEEHGKFGGVVPELAARAHVEKIDFIIDKALKDSGLALKDLDGIASTAGPGLIVCLNVGLNIGKAIAAFSEKPLFAINHLEGHALSPGLENKINFPYLLLLISGGHSQYLAVKGLGKYKQLGTTIDDALGEAFDKTGKMLGLNYPGGEKVEKIAKKGDKNFFKLPKPIINKAGCNLSFAGLKTAVLRETKKINSEKMKYNLAASFQNTINIILKRKTLVAMDLFRKNLSLNKKYPFVVAGGVAANKSIREGLSSICKDKYFLPIFPSLKFCGDNAAMIAWAGIQRFKKNKKNDYSFSAKSRWPLDKSAPYMKGPGLKLD